MKEYQKFLVIRSYDPTSITNTSLFLYLSSFADVSIFQCWWSKFTIRSALKRPLHLYVRRRYVVGVGLCSIEESEETVKKMTVVSVGVGGLNTARGANAPADDPRSCLIEHCRIPRPVLSHCLRNGLRAVPYFERCEREHGACGAGVSKNRLYG